MEKENTNLKFLPQALLDLIEQRRYGVEYQPIVATADGTIIGYEALARFYGANGNMLMPQHVFDLLHSSPFTLFQVEFEMKRLQITHSPSDCLRLFVNLDPDSFLAGAKGEFNPLVDLFSGYPGVVVEIIENSSINDADISETMASTFSTGNIKLALDDIGAPRTMLSIPILLAVDYLKFDRSWLQRLDDPVSYSALRHFVAFARECGKRTILEGIEHESQLAFAKKIGFDYVQGFLFKQSFQRTGCLAVTTDHPLQEYIQQGEAALEARHAVGENL